MTLDKESFKKRRQHLLETLHMADDSLELDPDACFEEYKYETFRKKFEIFLNTKSLKMVGNFIDRDTPVEVLCLECKHKWSDSPKKIMSDQCCLRCKGYGTNVKIDFFLWERTRAIIADKHGKTIQFSIFDPAIRPTVNDELIVKCKRGHKFTTTHRYLRRDRWCPFCPRELTTKETLTSNAVYKDRRKTKQAILNEVCKQKGVGMVSKKNSKGAIGLVCYSCDKRFRRTPYQILNNIYLCPSRCTKGIKCSYSNYNK